MGSGIAQIAAYHGFNVNLVDINEMILNGAKKSIRINLERFYLAKNKITKKEYDDTLKRIRLYDKITDAIKDVQIVIEAVFEDMELKQVLFAELDNLCDQNVILASNTSSLSISDIASKANHKERIVGIHFFNPAPIMKLVELIKGIKTSEKILERSRKFAEKLKKVVITVNDSPGFVTTRLLYVLCNEAINMKLNGIASTEDIDKACKLAFNFPMGPLELSDLVGTDVYNNIGNYLESELGAKYKPSSLLQMMVDDNLLGRKTKKGFYNY
jgi:3-hydroxybutyryl-CoA dehydrogenase